MAVSLVHKTLYTSVAGATSSTINLTATSTAGNWLLIAVGAEALVTFTTDQGENIPRIFAGSGLFDTFPTLYLLQSTKSCTTITFTVNLSRLMHFADIFELSGSGLAYTLTSGSSGSNISSLVGPSIVGPGSGTAFYCSGCGCGNFGGSTFSVSPGSWANLDTVVFLSGNNAVGAAYQLSNGTQQATFTLNSSNSNMGASGIVVYESASVVATTTTVTSNIDPSNLNQNVTFTATINGPGGSGSPTGTATFNIDGHNVATIAVSAVSTGISQAQYSTATLALGNHPVFASYSGDSSYLPSVSTPITQIVIQPCVFPFSYALFELSSRLFDYPPAFWSDAEKTYYIQEAFRTWNALTSYWRGDFTFQSSQGNVFYDITNSTTAPNTLRPHTITDVYLYNIIEYHLLEPVVGAGPWTGSNQFSMDDILNAVERRQNEILGVTGCAYSHYTVNAAPDRIYMLNTTLDIRRVAYIPETAALGTATPLFEDDTWGIGAFSPSYTTQPPGVPSTYRKSTEPLLSFDADVPPLPGTYDLITIESGPFLSLSTPSTFTIPDDWTWVLKWGALADLLGRESNAKDLPRAKYCEGRYKQGLQLLAAASAVLAIRYNNLPLQVDAIKSADLFNPTWQGQAQGQPTEALTAGLNLVALSPPPDAGPYSLTATVVENAPVPVNSNDCLNLTEDVFDVIIDYAQHLAAFKMGGEEFLMTELLLQRFMQMAALYSSKLAEQGEFTKILYAISQNEQNMNPRYTIDGDPADGGDQ